MIDPQLFLHPEVSLRDFPEDRPHENGNYINLCSFCNKTFVGHKRRVCCKLCEVTPTPKIGENKCLSPEV